jgi:hypothetical protein
MQSGTLGNASIAVPRAFLGRDIFGGIGGARHRVGCGRDRKAAFAALDEALALGIDMLDTVLCCAECGMPPRSNTALDRRASGCF